MGKKIEKFRGSPDHCGMTCEQDDFRVVVEMRAQHRVIYEKPDGGRDEYWEPVPMDGKVMFDTLTAVTLSEKEGGAAPCNG